MTTVRVAVPASVLLVTLAVAAVAWAAPGGGSGSGGARALGVVPSAGGGSMPAPETLQQGGTVPLPGPVTVAPVPPTPEIVLGIPPATDPAPHQDLIVPLDGQDAPAPVESGGTPAELTDSGGGGFGFLADTGFEIASLVTAGAAMVVAGLTIRDRPALSSR